MRQAIRLVAAPGSDVAVRPTASKACEIRAYESSVAGYVTVQMFTRHAVCMGMRLTLAQARDLRDALTLMVE